jgi:hypothetical protein
VANYNPTDIVGYKIVSANSSEQLQEKVQVLLIEESGWSPYGSLVVATFGPDEYPQWAQTMVLILED